MQPKHLKHATKNGDVVEKDAQFRCLSFTYRAHVLSPVAASRNKWPNNWWESWLYHEIDLDEAKDTHPLASPI